jgi:hypothetical protein
VGQPILAAAGFQPALAGCKGSLSARISRLKGGCGQNCPPHDLCRILKWPNGPNGDGRMGTSMIRACQGKTHLSLNLTEDFSEAR